MPHRDWMEIAGKLKETEMKSSRNAEITNQLTDVNDDIDQAVAKANRSRDDITLVAVSKTFPTEVIIPALQSGHRVFGENRVQEASGKWPQLRQDFPRVELHLIGPLQTNKTALAVSLFDCIETLDRPKLAKSIAVELEKQNKSIDLFVQVNTGSEPQKAGVLVDDLSEFLDYCQKKLDLSISGLMCIPPINENPEIHFSLLAKLAKIHNLAKLSMGMSSNFPLAINSGATHVRVGTAIFGQR